MRKLQSYESHFLVLCVFLDDAKIIESMDDCFDSVDHEASPFFSQFYPTMFVLLHLHPWNCEVKP